MNWLRQLRVRTERHRAAPALDSVLGGVNPSAPLMDRVAWMENLLAWVRRDVPATRLRLLFQILDRQPEKQAAVARTLRSLLRETQALDLFTETGLPRAAGFFAEAWQRLLGDLLPRPPVTPELGELFDRLFPEADDADWLESLEPALVERIAELWQFQREPDEPAWEAITPDLSDALVLLAARIRVIGCAPAIRRRLPQSAFRELAFQKLGPAVEVLVESAREKGGTADLAAELNYVRTLTDAGERALEEVASRLEETGVSTNVVYDLERLRALIRRLELLLEAWSDPNLQPTRAIVLLADLVRENHARRSVRALARQNLHLLTRRLVERNAETGEHYLARTRAEYFDLLRSALGGGAITAFTTLLKLALTGVVLAGFLEGMLAGLNYAASFVLIQLLGCTLATKQPATTAPALAGRMIELRDPRHREALVDEIVVLIRSQMAAVFGNLVAVIPAVFLLDWIWLQAAGHHWIDAAKATHIVDSLSPVSGTWLFAAFTGVLLWLSTLFAAWASNAYAFYQLRAAVTGNRRLQTLLGIPRAKHFAVWLEHNIAGLAGNITLGFLLGLTPKLAEFLGLPVEVRHVTLSTGQLAAAVAAAGPGVLRTWPMGWTLCGLLGIGVINIAVSFTLALWVAIRARDVRATERRTLYAAVLRRLVQRPWSFLIPLGDRVVEPGAAPINPPGRSAN